MHAIKKMWISSESKKIVDKVRTALRIETDRPAVQKIRWFEM